MINDNKYNWNNVEVYLGGKKITTNSIEYTSEDFKTILSHSFQTGTKIDIIPSYEFYLKRKNKYYFKNKFGVKFSIESDEILPLKKGNKINLI